MDDVPLYKPRPRPAFNCTGAKIVERFNPSDLRYSPKGPDEYMALSVSNWVSTQVMRVMLCAFQEELEAYMGSSALYGNAANDAIDANDANDANDTIE